MLNRLLLSGLTALAVSQVALADDAVPEGILDTLRQAAPGLEPDRVVASPMSGVFEVSVGAQVIYLSADGRYMMRGDLIDLQTRSNLTDATRREARLAVMREQQEKDMIVFGPEQEAKYTVTVFTDVDCGYCQKLHSEIGALNAGGVKVRYLAFPRAGIPSANYDKTVSVWCADDRREAITAAKAGKSVPYKSCDNPVKDQYNLGRAVGVTGTPTIVFENGEVLPGYVPHARLIKMLEEGGPG